jgi:hypothetical protein
MCWVIHCFLATSIGDRSGTFVRDFGGKEFLVELLLTLHSE